MQCGREADEPCIAPPGRRRSIERECPEVPAQAAQPQRLRASGAQHRTIGTAVCGLPGWCLRLDQARRWPAGGDIAADLCRRSRRTATAASARVAWALKSILRAERPGRRYLPLSTSSIEDR